MPTPMVPILITLLVIALVAYLAEQAMPPYFKAIRLLALVLALLVLLRFAGVF